MSLRSEYEWHLGIHAADPDHDDASSPWYELVREYLGEVRGLTLLEVACGRGGFVRELARAGAHVTGCDFSFAAVRVTAEKLRAGQVCARVVQGDAQRLPFASNSFDMVISCETIEHLPDARVGLREMHRVTRPSGRLLLTTPNYANFMGLYEVYANFRHPRRQDDQPFDRRQWFGQVRKWVRQAAWRILRSDGTVHQFPFLPGHNPVRWRSLEAHRGVRKILSPLAFTYFIEAEKKG